MLMIQIPTDRVCVLYVYILAYVVSLDQMRWSNNMSMWKKQIFF